MPLKPGSKLGAYEVVSSLGAGGMGEVYRARDSRLGRDVALKVLHARFASDPELRRRLDREARAISSLSHPHVCALYDIGHDEGVDFLVMEYLEGETLAARLARGALPLDQVLRYGIEIASALAAAHRRGIAHRDLKPGNVMLTRGGARLLDFGLAKPIDPSVTVEVTVSAPITAEGTLVGTYPYMSPEQVEGRAADARSDIFALGAVLYEMATGKRAFEGSTTASLVAAILERDPVPISTLQPLAPAALEDIVRGCLAKDADDRWQTAHDVKLQLEALRMRLAGGARAADSRRGRAGRLSRREAILASAVVALAVLTAVILTSRSPSTTGASPSTGPVRATLPPPPSHWFTPNDFAVSPDGRRVAFVAAGVDGVSSLWSWQVSSPESVRIAGTEGSGAPFWSPDGRWIAFFRSSRLMRVEAGGSGLQQIANVTPNSGGGSWGVGDVIVFAPNVIGPLAKIPASGGEPVPVTSVPQDMPGEAHRFPQFLPDGRRFLYLASWSNQQRGGVYLGSIDGAEPQLVASEIRSRPVLAGSHLLYATGGTVFARPFDVETGRLAGDPRPVLRNEVTASWRFGEAPISASPGLLAYQSRLNYNSQLVRYDRTGRELEAIGTSGFASPMLDPAGRRVAVSYDREGQGSWDTTILDLSRKVDYPLPRVGIHTAHAWSHDGEWIYYSAIRERNGIYRRRADGSGAEETVIESLAHLLVNSHAPNAPRFLYMDFSNGNPQLFEYDMTTRRARDLGLGAEAVYSPDGRWIAHVAFPIGIVVRRADGTGGLVHVVSGAGGWQVRWQRGMKELYYIASNKQLMAVPLTVQGDTIEAGAPKALFTTRIVQPRMVLFQYDTIDGAEFLINSLPRADAAAPLTLLVNWKEAIR